MKVTGVTYTPNAAGFAQLAYAPNGEVYAHLRKVGNQIERGAKKMVGVKTDALRASIHSRMGLDSRGLYVEVGSELSYAYDHHEGTRAHVIEPVHGRYLRFTSKGKVVYARRVLHPGTRSNRFLVVPMTIAVTSS